MKGKWYWACSQRGYWEIVYVYEGTYRKKTGTYARGWNGWTAVWNPDDYRELREIEAPC